MRYNLSIWQVSCLYSASTSSFPLESVEGFALLSASQEEESVEGEREEQQCVLLGIPSSVDGDGLTSFLGPYEKDIESILVIRSAASSSESMFSALLHKEPAVEEAEEDRTKSNNKEAVVVLRFNSKTALQAFVSIYHGLHFQDQDGDSEREAVPMRRPPCVALPLSSVLISNDAEGRQKGDDGEDEDEDEDKCKVEGEVADMACRNFITRFHLGEGNTLSHLHARNYARTSVNTAHTTQRVEGDADKLTQLLPTCALCFARIDSRITLSSNVPTTSAHPFEAGLVLNVDLLSLPCFVCRMEQHKKQGKVACSSCDIQENLWACLICGHLGCGRYTAEHARLHFHTFGHSFSLELATGRVWDYDRDDFVHDADLQGALHSQRQFEAEHTPYLSPLYGMHGMGRETHLDRSSFLYGEGDQQQQQRQQLLRQLQHEQRLDKTNQVHLERATQEKINDIMTDHEFILACQLEQQKLHYERLLARETRVALEKKQRAVEYHGPTVEREQEECEEGDPSTAAPRIDGHESDEYWRLKYAYATTSPEDVALVESLKTEISLLEGEYQVLTTATAEAEREHAAVKRRNSGLMQQQKVLMDAAAALDARAIELRQTTEREGAALLEQIRDINFYVDTQRRVGREGKGGDVIITQGTKKR